MGLKVLYLSQLVPYPADSGAKVRQYYTLRYLAQRHQVNLVAFSRSDDTPEAIDHLGRFCHAVRTAYMERSRLRDGLALVGSWLSGESFIIRRDEVPGMAALVQDDLLQGGYDVVHADQLWMAQYALLAAKLAAQGKIERPTLILDEHNACYQIFQRLAEGVRSPLKRRIMDREWRALQRYEAQTCARFDQVVTVTGEDRHILEDMTSKAAELSGQPTPRFSTIPICVDTTQVLQLVPLGSAPEVLHLGTMFWPPNVEGVLWFTSEVWPLIYSQVPGATFTVVGKNPPEQVRALAGQVKGINITGYVPDPQPYLKRASAFIVPLFSAGGMRVKIIDGWRWGLPIVSTTIGAEGIKYREGENILIADEPRSFAAAVVQVLQDSALNRRLRVSGRRWVEENYDWQRVYPVWDQVYQSG